MTPGQVFILVVGLVTLASVVAMGLSRSWAYRSTLVLILAWAAGQQWWLATGDPLPLQLYILTDLGALALLASWWGRREAMIASIYPAMWLAYWLEWAGHMSAYEAWWALYWLSMGQFLISAPWPKPRANRTKEGRRGTAAATQ